MAAAVKTVTAELSTNIRTFIWVVIIPIEVLMYGSYAILIDLSKVGKDQISHKIRLDKSVMSIKRHICE